MAAVSSVDPLPTAGVGGSTLTLQMPKSEAKLSQCPIASGRMEKAIITGKITESADLRIVFTAYLLYLEFTSRPVSVSGSAVRLHHHAIPATNPVATVELKCLAFLSV